MSSQYMKYDGSKPPTCSNADRRSSMHDPDSQPVVPSTGRPTSARYDRVQGLPGHHHPSTACPMPRPSDGKARADGYSCPSGVRIAGPRQPAEGQREAAASSSSSASGHHSTSGLATTSHSPDAPAAPALAARP